MNQATAKPDWTSVRDQSEGGTKEYLEMFMGSDEEWVPHRKPARAHTDILCFLRVAMHCTLHKLGRVSCGGKLGEEESRHEHGRPS